MHLFMCTVINMQFISASVHVKEEARKTEVTGNVERQRS